MKDKRTALYMRDALTFCLGGWIRHALLYYDNVAQFVGFRDEPLFERGADFVIPLAANAMHVAPDTLRLAFAEIQELHHMGVVRRFYLQDEQMREPLQKLQQDALEDLERVIDTEDVQDASKPEFALPITVDESILDVFLEFFRDRNIKTQVSVPQNLFVPREQGLLVPVKTTQLLLPNPLAGIYDSLLCTRVIALYREAGEEITLGSGDWDTVSYLHTHKANDSPSLKIDWHDIYPVPNDYVHLMEITDFKNRHGAELEAFRDEVDQFYIDLRQCESPKEVQSLVKSLNLKKKKGLRNLKAALKSYRIQTRAGYYASFFALSGGLAKLIESSEITNTGVLGVAAAGIVGLGLTYMRSRAKTQEEMAKSPYSYLYSAEKDGILNL